ncbi:MAG TPA: hydroxyacid dehydrogenase, partial [Sulfitobacter sp.]|nr:hydroxyacid dehydrogenase [Sulfitobacter sp.]
MTLNPADPAFEAALRADLSPDVFRAVEPRYLEEPRGLYAGKSAVLALPRTVEEVATLIRHANAARVGVIPYGGGTGLVGGQVADSGPAPLILSLERMNKLRAVYP